MTTPTPHLDAFRIRLAPDEATDPKAYIAADVTALHASGLLSWNVWQDGTDLFHAVESTEGIEALRRHGAELVDQPTALRLIWSMDLVEQASDRAFPLAAGSDWHSPHVTGFRTRLRPGKLEEYARVHARLPEPIAVRLRSAGVLSWTIWSDDETLFHTITTRHGRAAMREAGAKVAGPPVPGWDATIASLVDTTPETAQELTLIWGTNIHTQSTQTALASARTLEE